jgi:hypothetical protein
MMSGICLSCHIFHFKAPKWISVIFAVGFVLSELLNCNIDPYWPSITLTFYEAHTKLSVF